MERNIKLILCYDGTAYHGWQMQENAITVQQVLTEATERITSQKVSINGCSRTDAGVHANKFCCNFRTLADTDCRILMRGINALLPDDVAVLSVEDTDVDFHARFDCKGKEYIYKIWNSKVKNPFLKDKALHYPYTLDAGLMNEQAKYFIGTHDFSAFCAAGSTVKDNVRTVYDCGVKREGDLVTFYVKGDGFLYNMVRIMVGTLLYINSGKIERDTVTHIIESRDRLRAGITAKAYGLYLNEVYY